MGFQVSPGVEIKEFDLTAIVPAVTTTPTAFIGAFKWGPQDQRVLINSEKTLRETFGTPSTDTFYSTSWFIAQNFLTYGSNLLLGRVSLDGDQNSYSPGSVPVGTGDYLKIKNREDFEAKYSGSAITEFSFAAKFPGDLGNNIEVVVYDIDQKDFELNPLTSKSAGSKKLSKSEAVKLRGYVNNSAPDTSSYASVTNESAKDEIHIVVIDKTGKISGNKETVLETYIGLSKSPTAKNPDGTTNYWRNVINNKSQYIWAGESPEDVPEFDGDQTGYSTYTDITSAYVATGQSDDIGLVGKIYVAGKNIIISEIDNNNQDIGAALSSLKVGTGITLSEGAFSENFTIETITYLSSSKAWSITLDTSANVAFEAGTILVSFETLVWVNPEPTAEQTGSIKYYGAQTGEQISYSLADKNEIDQTNSIDRYTTSTIIGWDEEVDSQYSYFRAGIIVHKLGDGTLTTVNGANRSDVESTVASTVDQLFGDPETVDISLIIAGDLQTDGGAWAKDIIRIAEERKDCVAFVSPPTQDIIDAAPANRADIVLEFRNGSQSGVDDTYVGLGSSSYGVMDSGPKYQYDRYNDRFIYVPMCGDIAGTCVRTDTTRDPWYSPAGYDRGRINNIVKLVFNPDKEERDLLYQKGINPVVTFQGSGAILFGDKTLQTKASAFDRINVRRLFIVLEKAIATAAKFQLFEFNDAFTRNQFRQLVEPFLRDVQGRRGISSYAVVCDESNNPPSIIDSNQFVADIFVAPARSINFIKLNFVATPTGVQFAEFGG